MATSTTCTAATNAGNRLRFRFGKRELEFNSVDHCREYVAEQLTISALESILLAKWLDLDPTGATPSMAVNKTITADLSLATNIVRVT